MNRLYLAVPEAFSGSQCDRILALEALAGTEPGPVWGGQGYALDRTQRDVHAVFLSRSGAAGWLFERLDDLFARAAEAFGLPVGPIEEDIQLLRYEIGCHFRAWHSDAGRDRHASRRISLSVELSERGDYEGGELEIVPARIGQARTLPRGSVQLFPSQCLHRVTPVVRGTRRALVAWTGAPREEA